MKRFDRAIKVLNDELLRYAGKAVVEYVEKGHPIQLATKGMNVKNLKRAIQILEDHAENKHV